jgi:hypothetical protein
MFLSGRLVFSGFLERADELRQRIEPRLRGATCPIAVDFKLRASLLRWKFRANYQTLTGTPAGARRSIMPLMQSVFCRIIVQRKKEAIACLKSHRGRWECA